MPDSALDDPSRGYFPRAVFFFGFGLLVLPVLAGAASFFGRFGDTGSLLPWLAVLQCLRVRIRSDAPSRPAGLSARRYRSASPACQSTEPSRPRPETAMVNGCCKRARPGEGRAPVRSAQLEPGDGGIAAVPADDPPGEGVGLGRPGDSQLITSRPNNAEGIPTRACGHASRRAGSASMPVTTGCWLTGHADASDPSHDPSPPVRRLQQRPAAASNVVRSARVAFWRKPRQGLRGWMPGIKLMSDAGRRTGRAERGPARRAVGARPLPHRPRERRSLVSLLQGAADA